MDVGDGELKEVLFWLVDVVMVAGVDACSILPPPTAPVAAAIKHMAPRQHSHHVLRQGVEGTLGKSSKGNKDDRKESGKKRAKRREGRINYRGIIINVEARENGWRHCRWETRTRRGCMRKYKRMEKCIKIWKEEMKTAEARRNEIKEVGRKAGRKAISLGLSL